jgi:CopG family nickel-responsive transcriptional regulator
MSVVRFGVSMEPGLVGVLDDYVVAEGLANRSEALRKLVRQALVDREGSPGSAQTSESPVAGILSLVYPHGTRLDRVPTAPWPSIEVIANLQVHISPGLVLKIMALRGLAAELEAWAARVRNQRGLSGSFSLVSSAGLEASFAPESHDGP